jgi:hypothetical protein
MARAFARCGRHPLRPNAPLIWGIALLLTVFLFLPLFRIRKQKRLKENRRVCHRLRSTQNRVKLLFRPMLTFAYAGARFVSARKRVSKPARDDVSCDDSRAERVGRILAASFTTVSIVYERKQRIRTRRGDVSLCFACGARQSNPCLFFYGRSAHSSSAFSRTVSRNRMMNS